MNLDASGLKKPIILSFWWLAFSILVARGTCVGNVPAADVKHQPVHLKTVIVADYYPYSFVNKEGTPDGFSVDLAKAIASAMNVDLDIGVETWDSAKQKMERGDIDLLPMMAYSEERATSFDFSVPHTIAYDALFTRKGSNMTASLPDFKERTLIVMRNDQAHDYLRSQGFSDSGLILVNGLPEALKILASGKGDAALMPKLVGLTILKDLDFINISRTPVVLESYNRPFCLAVRKGNQSLLERLNQGLNIVRSTGQYDKIYKKWFGAIEPTGISWISVLKYFIAFIAFFVFITLVLLLWNLSLKKQVASRTILLEGEINERRLTEDLLTKSEARFRAIFDSIPDSVFFADADLRIILTNPAFTKWFGYEGTEVIGRTPEFLYENQADYVEQLPSRFGTNKVNDAVLYEICYRRKDGSVFWAESVAVHVFSRDGSPLGLMGVHRDITERKRAEEALRDSEERLKFVLEGSQLGLWDWNIETNAVQRNERWAQMLGYTPEEIQSSIKQWTDLHHPDDRAAAWKSIDDHLKGLTPFHEIEYRMCCKDGQYKWILDRARIVKRDAEGRPIRMSGTHTDITEKKQAQQEREQLQRQLDQAQRLEAVGRLAGGVAHDFNNMLGVILGHADLVLSEIGSNNPIYHDVIQMRIAAERSADLTRQLLAFARKQTVSPKVLDLNETVSGILKMLRRLIGEDISLAWKPGMEVWSVKMDPSQVDQILANLAINARDAMTGVGSMTIETANVIFDESYCDTHNGFNCGSYVMLAVSDTGSGMDKQTLDHIFEPFFTTKEVGKGTGLGLATVYGIIKQNHGFINVYSEPAQGTTFKIYIPRADEPTAEKAPADLKKDLRGTETVLLVEDEEPILALGKTILQRHGYEVLATSSPTKALGKAQSYPGPIHLLITDVVMPEMNGKSLKERLTEVKPGFKSIFMSGYTANVIAHHGILDEGIEFLQKPFSVQTLLEKVRNVLDG